MRIAIVGGIGSGKSTVRRELVRKLKSTAEFAEVADVNVDILTARLYENPEFMEKLETCLGVKTKAETAQKVFSNRDALKLLEALAEPFLRESITEVLSSNTDVVLEFPLLLQLPDYWSDFDYIVMVSASKEVRWERVMMRDGRTPEQLEMIDKNAGMTRTLSELTDRLAATGLPCSCLPNEGSLAELLPALDAVVINLIREKQARCTKIKPLLPAIPKVGVFAGSFDPITLGHLWMIKEAATLFDKLYVVVGVNGAKKYLFSDEERVSLVADAIETLPEDLRVKVRVIFSRNELLINVAQKLQATYLVRGIRSIIDYQFEAELAKVNAGIAPSIRTITLLTPPEMSQISSSTVKSLVIGKNWEMIVEPYVTPGVLAALAKKYAR